MHLFILAFLNVSSSAEAATIATCDSAPDPTISVLKRTTVRVETMAGSGSGVIVSPDGWILTAAHVVGSARKVDVVFTDGSTIKADVVRTTPDADSALIRVEGKFPCAPLTSTTPESGTDAIVIGSPLGATLAQSVTKGVVSAVRETDEFRVLQTDAAVNPGNSGGPLFAADGSLAGIVSFKAGAGAEGLAFAIYAEDMLKNMKVELGSATAGVEPLFMEPTSVVEESVSDGATFVVDDKTPDATIDLEKKKACKSFKQTEDPINKSISYDRYVHDLYRMHFEERPSVEFFYPLHTYNRPSDMATHVQGLGAKKDELGSVKIVALLDGGTTVTIEGGALAAQSVSAVEGRFLVKVEPSVEALKAFAQNPVEMLQWTVAERKFVQKVSGKGSKYYQTPLSCLYHLSQE